MLLYMVNSGTCNNYITFRFFSASFLWKIQYYLYNHVYHVTHFMQDLLGAHHWFGHGHAIHIAIVCTYRDVTAPRKSTGRLLLLMDPQEHWIIGSLDLNFKNHVNISMNLSSAVNCQLPQHQLFFCRGGSRRQSVGRIPILTREPVLHIGSKAGKARSHRATG